MIASVRLDSSHIALSHPIVPVRAHFTRSHTEGMRELTLVQRNLLDGWLDDWEVLADLSWPLQDTAVLDVRSGGRRYIVKASRASHHIAREIDAHDQFLRRFSVWVPQLAHSSRDGLILVTHYLPGELVEGTDAEVDPEIYRQAGCRLKQLLLPGPLSGIRGLHPKACHRRQAVDFAGSLTGARSAAHGTRGTACFRLDPPSGSFVYSR